MEVFSAVPLQDDVRAVKQSIGWLEGIHETEEDDSGDDTQRRPFACSPSIGSGDRPRANN
jgi:hypothetical protein